MCRREECVEVGSGELPLERMGGALAVVLEGQDGTGEVGRGHIRGRDLVDEPVERLDAHGVLDASEQIGSMGVPGRRVSERLAPPVLRHSP
jgi:hypothetical protein